MISLNEDVRTVVAHAQLSFVVTSRPDASPSLDGLHGRRFSRNEDESPWRHRLEIDSVDFLRRRGYRFGGQAELRDQGDDVSIGLASGRSRSMDPDIPRTAPGWCTSI